MAEAQHPIYHLRNTVAQYKDAADLYEHMDMLLGPAGWRVSYRWIMADQLVCKLEVHHPDAGPEYPWVCREVVGDHPMKALCGAVQAWGVKLVRAKPPEPDQKLTPVELFKVMIREATDQEGLNEIAAAIRETEGLTEQEQAVLRDAWKRRQKGLDT